MKTILKGILAVAVITIVFTERSKLCEGFLPENSVRIGVNDKSAGGLSKEEYYSVMIEIGEAYNATFEKLGTRLRIVDGWNSPQVNAFATHTWFGEPMISVLGGLARHPMMTKDMLRIVACHEIGHHLAGAPMDGHMSVEGQSDYYAGLSCFRHIIKGKEEVEILDSVLVAEQLKVDCAADYTTKEEQAICVRAKLAALQTGLFFASFAGTEDPSFETPDQEEVSETTPEYPSPQCRMDTVAAAATCKKSSPLVLSQTDESFGVCNEGVDNKGFRPRCWYKPSLNASIQP